MATTYATSASMHAGIGHSYSTTTTASSMNPRDSSNSSSSGFKVCGSLFKVDARYQFLNPLGKGSYGIVCAAKDRETGLSMAIKRVSLMTKRMADAKHTLREVLLLQLLGKHPNIISIHNLSTNVKDDELYIVMDTDMHRVIQSSQVLSESHVKYFLHQLLRGVKYLHDNGVPHRDLKPGNLLLSKTCQLTKLDLRSLILKEVDSCRKSVTRLAVSDNELSDEEIRERAAEGTAGNSQSIPHAASIKQQQLRQERPGPGDGAGLLGSTASSHSKSQPKVMCGSAGISMINSLLRQPLSSSQNQDQPQQC